MATHHYAQITREAAFCLFIGNITVALLHRNSRARTHSHRTALTGFRAAAFSSETFSSFSESKLLKKKNNCARLAKV